MKAEKNGEPVYVNGKQVGKTPFSGSVPLCAVVEIGKDREMVNVELEHNGRVEHTVEGYYDSRDYRTSNGNFKVTTEKETLEQRIERLKSQKLLTDSRDGKQYKIVKIGTQTWMAENLNYNASGSRCYDNSPAYCQTYGRLYNWATAMKACPKGWHLPSDMEWKTLTSYVGSTEGKYLKATSGWNSNGNGTDDYGFSALPGGNGGSDGYVGDFGYWWSASEGNSSSAYLRIMFCSSEGVLRIDGGKGGLFSVRCLQD